MILVKDKLDTEAIKLAVDNLTLLKDFSENEYYAISYLEKIIGKENIENKDIVKMSRTLKPLGKKGLLYISRFDGPKTFYRTTDFGREIVEKISELTPSPKMQDLTQNNLDILKNYIHNILNFGSSFELHHNLKSLDRFLYENKNTKWYDAEWFDNKEGKEKNLVERILFLLQNIYNTLNDEDREYILRIVKKIFNNIDNKPTLLLRHEGGIDANNSSCWFYDYKIKIDKKDMANINLVDTLIDLYDEEKKFRKEILLILSKITDENGNLPKKIIDFLWDQFLEKSSDECTSLWMYDHLMGKNRSLKDKGHFMNRCKDWIKEKESNNTLSDEDMKKSEILSEEFIRRQDKLL